MDEVVEQLYKDLKDPNNPLFPGAKPPRQGHPYFYELTKLEELLHETKNKGYAGTGDTLGNFRRAAAIFRNYPNLDAGDPLVQLFAYIFKHLDAVMLAINDGIITTENSEERLMDISVYCKLAACLLKERDLVRHNING